jgi:hypothetical protein
MTIEKMKTTTQALAALYLAAGPAFAAGSASLSYLRHLQEERDTAYVPFRDGLPTDTSRQGLTRTF